MKQLRILERPAYEEYSRANVIKSILDLDPLRSFSSFVPALLPLSFYVLLLLTTNTCGFPSASRPQATRSKLPFTPLAQRAGSAWDATVSRVFWLLTNTDVYKAMKNLSCFWMHISYPDWHCRDVLQDEAEASPARTQCLRSHPHVAPITSSNFPHTHHFSLDYSLNKLLTNKSHFRDYFAFTLPKTQDNTKSSTHIRWTFIKSSLCTRHCANADKVMKKTENWRTWTLSQ